MCGEQVGRGDVNQNCDVEPCKKCVSASALGKLRPQVEHFVVAELFCYIFGGMFRIINLLEVPVVIVL